MASGRRGEPEVRSAICRGEVCHPCVHPCFRFGVCCAWRCVSVMGSVRVRVTIASLLPLPSLYHVILAHVVHRPIVVRFGRPASQVHHNPLDHAILVLPSVTEKSEESRTRGKREWPSSRREMRRESRREEGEESACSSLSGSRSRPVLRPWVPKGPL